MSGASSVDTQSYITPDNRRKSDISIADIAKCVLCHCELLGPSSHAVSRSVVAAQLNLCSLFVTSDPKMETQCVSFTLPQQFSPKYKYPGNQNSEEDLLRTCETALLPSCLHIT